MDAAYSRVFVGLGSNLGDRLATLRSATQSLQRGDAPRTWLTQPSSIYETRPIGPSDEPFLNAVVELTTTLAPPRLLVALTGIEAAHGRVRDQRWQARTLDLDIIAWLVVDANFERSLRLRTDTLTIPHPRALDRDFVLRPLAELLGDTEVFGKTSAASALTALAPEARTILHRLPNDLCGAVPHA